MKNISLKIDSDIFKKTEEILSGIQISRNRYINDAIDYYNKIQEIKLLKSKLKEESEMVREESMRVLNEFEN